MDSNVHQDAVRDLLQKKQALLMELKNYESNTRSSNIAGGQNMNAGIIPVSITIVHVKFYIDKFLLILCFLGKN